MIETADLYNKSSLATPGHPLNRLDRHPTDPDYYLAIDI
jgi:hypothetical protein